MLYARKAPWLEKLPPFLGGGEMILDVTQDNVTYNAPPHRFEAGTPPIIEAVGLGAALDYMLEYRAGSGSRSTRRRSATMPWSGSAG